MIKNIAIVSLSSGIIGEPFVDFEVEIGLKRLKEYGLSVKFMPNALKGIEYIKAHPEKRAEDLLDALRDTDIDMILCAIGGDDTYRLLPYLFGNNELMEAAKDKIFLGFSDTTIDHFMLHKAGIRSFYGQAFLPDICELDESMLPYTRRYFEELISTGTIKCIRPSDIWYEERKSFSPDQVGTPHISHPDHGFELLQGSPVFSGKILGGCIDSMDDIFSGDRYEDMPVLCKKYGLFPSAEDWKGRILLLETSQEKMSPEKYRRALEHLKDAGVFANVSGVIAGKPMDDTYSAEYKRLLKEVIDMPSLPIVFNLNIGHSLPRCIIPFGVDAVVDINRQEIRFGGDHGIELDQLTEENFEYALGIDRDDIPEEWVDTASTIMETTLYGLEHGLIGHTYLARLGDKYVGLLMLGEALPWPTDPEEMHGKPFYRLMGFTVDKSYRNRGIGGEMLEKAIEQVYREFGERSIALGVHRDNARVGRFYERHGFVRTGVFEGNDEYYLRLI